MSRVQLETIKSNRKIWNDFNKGVLVKTSIDELEELHHHLEQAISILAMFPETESTRMYLCFQESALSRIIFHRKFDGKL